MVEIAHKEVEVRRQRYGVEADGNKGGISSLAGPKNVEESLNRLRALEDRSRVFREAQRQKDLRRGNKSAANGESKENEESTQATPTESSIPPPATPPVTHKQEEESQKSSIPQFRQGTLIHRSEAELKTHTSYLVFATLPCAWSEEDERRCREKWPSNGKAKVPTSETPRKSFRQLKAEAKAEKERSAKADAAGNA